MKGYLVMQPSARLCSLVPLSFCLLATGFSQSPVATPTPPLTPTQIVDKVTPSIAVVLASSSPTQTVGSVGTAIVVGSNGVLLTAYHVVKNAYAVQIHFKNGEVYDQVQLLGVDARRDVAAIKITSSGLPALSIASAADAHSGDPLTTISNAAALPWSASTGVVSAVRLADDVPGAGSGYKIIQFTAPESRGSSGGVVIDGQGRGLGLIVASLGTGQNLNFAVPLESVTGLADTTAVKTYANGSYITTPWPANPTAAPILTAPQNPKDASPGAPEKSDILSASKDPKFILENFKTMYVDGKGASFFGADQIKANLERNSGFSALHIDIVDDPKVADTVLVVGYTFPFDFPFELKYQNTSMVLLGGKGVGVLSGPAGSADVARQFIKLAKPYRVPKKTK